MPAIFRDLVRAVSARLTGGAIGDGPGDLDRRLLADIGIGRGEVLSVVQEVGVDRLRRPPHI
jgi:hypothetical protein